MKSKVLRIDMFYGTDDLYLNYLARFVKPGGPVGIALAGYRSWRRKMKGRFSRWKPMPGATSVTSARSVNAVGPQSCSTQS